MAKKILIIEDEKALIRNLELALRDEYEVLSAVSAEEGLSKIKKNKPDLILLDVILPDKDGIEVLQKLKSGKDTRDIPVIVLTNLSDSVTVSKILAAGGKEYLVKSDWGISEIVKKIETII
ncbi:MAG: response regulator [Patescibacteria group bacterium]|jgi:two-component system alkaline phosphatase synthesis response regulator PhoP